MAERAARAAIRMQRRRTLRRCRVWFVSPMVTGAELDAMLRREPGAIIEVPYGIAPPLPPTHFVHIRKTIHVSPETDVLAARAVQRLAARQEYERQARHMGIPCR